MLVKTEAGELVFEGQLGEMRNIVFLDSQVFIMLFSPSFQVIAHLSVLPKTRQFTELLTVIGTVKLKMESRTTSLCFTTKRTLKVYHR